jgi:integrase
MPIRKDAEGRYHAEVCVNNRRLHRRLPEGSTAGDAKRLEAELRRALHAVKDQPKRAPVVPGDPLLSELMADYTERHCLTLRSPETAQFHGYRIGRWLEGKRASETRQVAGAIRDDLLKAYAPATVNRSLGALKKALSMAWEQDKTSVDYSGLIKRIPENNQRTTYLSLAEVRALTDHASDAVKAAVWIALYTGCRRGEVCKLQAEDIGRDTIRIQAGNTKTLRYREVPIVPPLRPWLEQVPLPINFEGLKTGFRRAREAAGMEHVNFHDLRRSCATILIQSGAELHVVSKILGHSSTKVTESRYAFLDQGQMGDAMKKAFG